LGELTDEYCTIINFERPKERTVAKKCHLANKEQTAQSKEVNYNPDTSSNTKL